MDWMGTPEFRALMKIEEPYEYRDRLTLPKFIVNAAGDQFFLPDSSQFYFDDLRGEKHLRYVPNTGHSLDEDRRDRERARVLRRRWSRERRARRSTWTFERDGSIKVKTKERPTRCGSGRRPIPARNFRHDVIGPAYTSTADALGPEHLDRARPDAADGVDRLLRRDDVRERREVSVQGDQRRARGARHAAVPAAEAHATEVDPPSAGPTSSGTSSSARRSTPGARTARAETPRRT